MSGDDLSASLPNNKFFEREEQEKLVRKCAFYTVPTFFSPSHFSTTKIVKLIDSNLPKVNLRPPPRIFLRTEIKFSLLVRLNCCRRSNWEPLAGFNLQCRKSNGSVVGSKAGMTQRRYFSCYCCSQNGFIFNMARLLFLAGCKRFASSFLFSRLGPLFADGRKVEERRRWRHHLNLRWALPLFPTCFSST